MAYLLIVDDDVDFSAAVATVLSGEGYETSIEDHPEGAMNSLKKRLPDAVVLDVMFPENPTAGFATWPAPFGGRTRTCRS